MSLLKLVALNKTNIGNQPIEVYLLYHINFNHLSLSFAQRAYYIENYLEKLLEAIIVPSTIAVCPEDLLLLKNWNPKCFQKLIKHRKLKFLLTPYNHVLPHLFPDIFIENAQLGVKSLKRLIRADKILPIGYSPEVDLPQEDLLSRLSVFWNGLILGESRINIKGWLEEEYPPVFLISDQQKRLTLKGYLSRRYIQYRDYLHKYLRTEVGLDDVYNAIIHDYQKYSQPEPLLLRVDLEALIFNDISTLKSDFLQSPVSLFLNLQKFLVRSGINFLHIGDVTTLQNRVFTTGQILPSPSENYKWKNPTLKGIVTSFRIDASSWEKYFNQISLTCSDYYCTNFSDIRLWHYRGNCTVRIIKNRRYRDQESAIKLKLTLDKLNPQEVIARVKNTDLSKYFYYFQRSMAEAKYFLNEKD